MQTQNAHSSGHVLGLSFSGFICTATVIVLSVQLVAEDDLNVRASWSNPTSGQAETRMREWLDTRNINEDAPEMVARDHPNSASNSEKNTPNVNTQPRYII